MQNDPPQGKCLETADSVAMTLKSDGKDVYMEHLSNPAIVSTPAPICVPDTIAKYYDRRKLERWYSDEKVDKIIVELLCSRRSPRLQKRSRRSGLFRE